jgi:HlyD family secretion protein
VLDAPNASLDAAGDTALTDAIMAVRRRGGIAIVIAHRPSALAAVNKGSGDGQRASARLRAERRRAAHHAAHRSTSVTFPDELIARGAEPDVAEILKGEQILFETRANQKQQLGERTTGLRQESAGNTAQAEAKARGIALIKKELDGLEGLERQQLVRTEKMTSRLREQARTEGEMAQLSAAAGQSKDRIAGIEMQRLSIESEAKSEVIKELRATQGKLVELFERLHGSSRSVEAHRYPQPR